MKATVFKCDGCGREKQQANHWYVVFPDIEGVGIYKWDEKKLGEHYCGTECLFKRLAQWAQ